MRLNCNFPHRIRIFNYGKAGNDSGRNLDEYTHTTIEIFIIFIYILPAADSKYSEYFGDMVFQGIKKEKEDTA